MMQVLEEDDFFDANTIIITLSVIGTVSDEDSGDEGSRGVDQNSNQSQLLAHSKLVITKSDGCCERFGDPEQLHISVLSFHDEEPILPAAPLPPTTANSLSSASCPLQPYAGAQEGQPYGLFWSLGNCSERLDIGTA